MPELYERELSRAEIEARKNDLLVLLGERDSEQSTIDEHKREIKDHKVELARIDARLIQLRHEIRSGKVLETREPQLSFADTLVDRPADPEYPVQHADAEGNAVEDPREPPTNSKKRKR